MKNFKKTALLFMLCIANFYAHSQSYPDMVFVKGGTFNMGDEFGTGDDNELPIHKVILNSFKIAKTLTTVAQWKFYCKSTNKQMPTEPSWGWKDDNPIVNINWNDAVDYCNWLSDETGVSYRLPPEAEWEFAARGGINSKGFKYSGGQNPEMVGWFNSDGNGTHAVAQKQANELGLYDMSGNVWEWCSDWYSNYQSSPSHNPKGPATGSGRVLRGGSWYYTASECRVANRYGGYPDGRGNFIGFRVVSSEQTDVALYPFQLLSH